MIVLLRFPVAFAAKPPTSLRLLAAAPLAIGVLLLLRSRRPSRAVSLLGVLAGGFVLLIMVALFRGEAAHAYADSRTVYYEVGLFFLLVTFGYLYFASARDKAERHHRAFILCCSPGVYVAVQAILHIVGVHHIAVSSDEVSASAGTPAQLLGLFGIHTHRVLFPLANGVVNFGDTIGASLAASALLSIKLTGRLRHVAIALLIVSIYGLLTTDARAALLCALGAVIVALLVGERRALASVAFLVPATTAIMSLALGLVAQTSLVETFSRKGNDLVTATDRTVIWHAVLSFLSHFNVAQIFGYGTNGQISSGANAGYEYLFYGTPNPSVYSTHNFMLQTVLDIGYMGLLVFVVLLFLTMRRLQRMITVDESIPARALLGVLLYFIFNGATDTSPSIYSPETMYFFFLITTCVAATRLPRKQKKAAPIRDFYRRPVVHTGSRLQGHEGAIPRV
jgi:O-antigen ligase